jgi:hypothetical protein
VRLKGRGKTTGIWILDFKSNTILMMSFPCSKLALAFPCLTNTGRTKGCVGSGAWLYRTRLKEKDELQPQNLDSNKSPKDAISYWSQVKTAWPSIHKTSVRTLNLCPCLTVIFPHCYADSVVTDPKILTEISMKTFDC